MNYKIVEDSLKTGDIPDRDYDLLYSQEKIKDFYDRGLLNKTEKTQYEKREKQLAEGKSRVVKPVEKGDWQCRLCEYKDICYDSKSKPKEL